MKNLNLKLGLLVSVFVLSIMANARPNVVGDNEVTIVSTNAFESQCIKAEELYPQRILANFKKTRVEMTGSNVVLITGYFLDSECTHVVFLKTSTGATEASKEGTLLTLTHSETAITVMSRRRESDERYRQGSDSTKAELIKISVVAARLAAEITNRPIYVSMPNERRYKDLQSSMVITPEKKILVMDGEILNPIQ